MSMLTPLKKVRYLGSAKSGTSHFWQQRLTAVFNVPLVIGFLVIAAILSVTWHMRLGMQVVIEDYIHAEGMKIALLLGNTFFSAAIALISVFSILKLSFGG